MKTVLFTRYEKIVIAIVALVQFTVIVDFMVMSPLGVILIDEFQITPQQFAMVVSAYAFSAAASGLLAAGFADRFDRKKLLLFFYIGFLGGTLLCGLAHTYEALMAARVITGIFGGVVGSVGYAIVTDLFKPEVRGRVMGFVQMAFAGSQILGMPIGMFLAPRWGWNVAFYLIVGVGLVVAFMIAFSLRPVVEHLKIKNHQNAFVHLGKTLVQWPYFKAFCATVLLATGGFMLMPFGSTYSQYNLGIDVNMLWVLYLITGICSMATGPFIGKLSDTVGKYPMFIFGSALSSIVVLIYCNLGLTPFWGVCLVSCVMFIGISARIISSTALMSIVPAPQDRGAFMSINSSTQYLAGGIATYIAGLIIEQKTPTSKVENFDILGYTVVGSMAITVLMMYFINQQVARKLAATSDQGSVKPEPEVVKS
jgi:predicted MFS family arabinose efflux permease